MFLQKTTKQIGTTGEELACEYLKKQGYKILKRNYLIRGGEIDIIAMDRQTLVFVEVKTRHGKEYGYAREAVTPWKLRYLFKAALVYIQRVNWGNKPYRFDLVAIDYDSNNSASIEIIRNISL